MNLFLMFTFITLTALISISGGIALLLGENLKLVKKIEKFGPIIAFFVLIFAIFGDIIPEILEENELEIPTLIFLVATGFIFAALIGKIMGHFHHHSDLHVHKKGTVHGDKVFDKTSATTRAYTMLIVDSVHSIADGFVLGSAFLANPATGISACLATIAHEIPQEISDFDICRRAGLKRLKILKFQIISSIIIIPASFIAYFIGSELLELLPSVLAIVSGFLLYIAIGELTHFAKIFKK